MLIRYSFTYHYNSSGNMDEGIKPFGNKVTYIYNNMDQGASVTVSMSLFNNRARLLKIPHIDNRNNLNKCEVLHLN